MRPYDCPYFLFIWIQLNLRVQVKPLPIGSMYAIYGNIYHQYTPNVSIYTIHGSYGLLMVSFKVKQRNAYVASSAAEKMGCCRGSSRGVVIVFLGYRGPKNRMRMRKSSTSEMPWDVSWRGKKRVFCRGRWRSELKLLKWVGLKIAYPYIQWLMIFPIGIAFWGSTPIFRPKWYRISWPEGWRKQFDGSINHGSTKLGIP